MTVVLDSSALITFARIGRLELLRQITGDAYVPDAVSEEVVQKGAGRPGSAEMAQATWILRQGVRDLTAVEHLHVRVGRREAEAIVLAKEFGADRLCTPGDEGKWFAAAKDIGLRDLALQLAQQSPCDPRTLNRAARDHLGTDPAFAHEVALASLRWLSEGWGYEITGLDVLGAHELATKAAAALGRQDETEARIRALVESDRSPGVFVRRVLGRFVGLP